MLRQIEKITKFLNDWKPVDLAFIIGIELIGKNATIRFLSQKRNRLNTWPDLSGEFFEITIWFKSVSNFKIQFTEIGMQPIAGFDIIDISGNSWEGVNFQIEDYENGRISFYCREIEIESFSKQSTDV
jgi:hypothetical protein